MEYRKTAIETSPGVWQDGVIVISDTTQSFSGEIALPDGQRYLVEPYKHKQDGGKRYYWFLIVQRVEDNSERLKIIEAQIKAQSDHADFMEDCFAELATLVL